MWLLFWQAIWKYHEIFAELYSLFTWRTRNFNTRRCYKSSFVAAPSVIYTNIWRHAMLYTAWHSSKLTNIRSFSWALLMYVFHLLGCLLSVSRGTRWRISLRHCATSRKVEALIPCDLTFPAALWMWSRLSLQQRWIPGIFCGSKDGRCLGLTTLPL